MARCFPVSTFLSGPAFVLTGTAFVLLAFLALLLVALVLVALLLVGLAFVVPDPAELFTAGAFLALLALVTFVLAALLLPEPLLVGPALAGLALVGLALAVVLRAGDDVAAEASLAAVTRRFDGSVVFFAAVESPVAAFADVADRPAMATALCPRSWDSVPLRAVRP
jgi:hypothetical protein